MSSHIVSIETLSLISEFIAIQNNIGFNYTGISTSYDLESIFIDCKINKRYNEKMIFDKLYIENEKAVNGRYTDSSYIIPEILPEYKETDIIKPRNIDKKWYITLFKKLQCYLYQIEEDATINGPIYKTLEAVKNTLASTIFITSQ